MDFIVRQDTTLMMNLLVVDTPIPFAARLANSDGEVESGKGQVACNDWADGFVPELQKNVDQQLECGTRLKWYPSIE